MTFTAAQLIRMTAEIYRGRQGLGLPLWLITVLRPWYGIYGESFRWIPEGSRVLDIGCGAGGFLLLAHRLLKLGPSVGYDINAAAIQLAQSVSTGIDIRFEVCAEVPAAALAEANVITLIDVLHHLDASRRAELLDQLVAGLSAGARLVIKDLDPKPAWRARANEITDYASTRSRVSYISLDELQAQLRSRGLVVLEHKRVLKHVWSHYLLVVERPSASGLRTPNRPTHSAEP